MRPFIALLALALVSACTGEPIPVGQTSVAVGQQISCIDATRIAGRRAPDNRTLVFEIAGAGTFRNDLQEVCPGIERASNFGTLAIDPMESRMCAGDMVRVYDPEVIRGSSIKTAARCRLGTFTRIDRPER